LSGPSAKDSLAQADISNEHHQRQQGARALLTIAVAAAAIWLFIGVLAVVACLRSSQADRRADQHTSESSDEFPQAVNF